METQVDQLVQARIFFDGTNYPPGDKRSPLALCFIVPHKNHLHVRLQV
jgi:hypothetical protein